MESYTNELQKNQITVANISGFPMLSDPEQYTSNSFSFIIPFNFSIVSDLVSKALDNLPDEIGITHETVSGEVPECNSD